MQFSCGCAHVSEVEKVHSQKSDIFAMSKREVYIVITSGVQSYHIAPQDPSENHANTIGKRDVFENGAVAGTFHVFEL